MPWILLPFTSVTMVASPAGTDTFVGTWKLDVVTYKNNLGSTWKTRTIKVKKTSSGYHVSMDGVHGEGSPLRFTFNANSDGLDYPVSQTAGVLYLDAIVLTQGNNVELTH